MIRAVAEITDADRQYIYLRVPYNPEYVRQDMRKAVVFLEDGRQRSLEQNGKVWAMLGEIARWAGYKQGETSDVNAQMKKDFLIKRFDTLEAAAIKSFSMGTADVTTVSLYIGFLIDFILENNVPTNRPVTEYCEDIQAAVYSAAIHKRCICCGKAAELHHVDRIGMGGDRHDMCHIGLKALPLCREHHMEAHQHGDDALMDKYHLEPIVIDAKIAKVYKLTTKRRKDT